MKKSRFTILGVALTLMLLGSLVGASLPATAGTLSWSSFSPVPSGTNEILEDCDVVDLGVAGDGETIYAVSGTGAYYYKSTDSGTTWGGYNFDTASTGNDSDLVAIAPDDSSIVAIADTDTLQVWITTNGGSTWGSIGKPQETGDAACTVIKDIAISAAKSGIHYVGVAGEESGPIANVWYYDVGDASPVWTETNSLTGFDATTGNSTAAAVVFSPNFPSDEVMLVVTEDDQGTTAADYVRLELFSFDSKEWNDDAGFDGYGVTIVEDTAITDVDYASIAVSPDYLGADDAMRLVYIGLDLTGDETYNGIHRADDTVTKTLKSGDAVKIQSVAYNGSVLVAGRSDANTCYHSADPTATTPTVSTTRSYKRPGGSAATNAVVAWAGDDVVAGTSGTQSAFAVSTNDAVSFNDISLIDDSLDTIQDVAVSADGSSLYMTSDNSANGISLWRYASSWQRVLAVNGQTNFIIRLAPNDGDVIYAVDEDAKTIYYSADGGTERWQKRTSYYSVQDLAVEADGDVAYVIISGDGKVSKSTNSGFTWGTSTSSKLTSGYMITSLGEDKVLATSTNGYVTYSIDGGSSWTKVSKAAGGNELVATASGLADEDYIYAGTHDTDTADRHVYRWQLSVSTSWDKITAESAIPASYEAYGIALQEGVLYVNTANASDASKLFRTTGPTADPTVYWSTPTSTASFSTEPQGLKVGASGSSKLYAIDTENSVLYSYTDTLTTAVPTLDTPKDAYVNKTNPISGYSNDITFTWERPSSKVTAYDLRIYDADGNKVKNISVSSDLSTVSQVVGKDITDAAFTFQPGETYQWKVRVSSSGPVFSGWSEGRAFSVEAAEAPEMQVTVEAPAAQAPQVTVQAPPAPEVTVTVPPASAPVAPSTPAYIWAIVIIGAVLVIALIVLIIRTRRVA